MSSEVFFTDSISPEKVVELYDRLGVKLAGKVAVKVHSGEKGNQNFIRPEFWEPMIAAIGGTVVECNTAYDGARNTTERHIGLMKEHGWSEHFKVDIMDAEGPDLRVPVKNGFVLKENLLGKHIENYDSMAVLSHFKGHPMGGFGGALKQLSIGCASAAGKAYIHSAGVTEDVSKVWANTAEQTKFLEAMADAASTVVDMFKGKIIFINVMCNMSVDCDCCAVAEDPCMPDLGMLASTDPVAVDRACLDLVYSSKAPGSRHLIERIESRKGEHTVIAAEKLGIGSQDYRLIRI